MATPLSLPPVIGGKYRPVREIARGGMGVVYEAVHLNTGERLALKLMLARSLLAPEARARFRREARIPSSIKSNHVVRVIDADVAPELDGAPYLVMELLEGQDLESLARSRAPQPAEVLGWLRQVGQALDKAHEQRIVHRDLKPQNLFLATQNDQPPTMKVLDFGVAKFLSDGEDGSTTSGQIVGTPRYMAPEQAAGAKNLTGAVDRFALGLIVFRLLAGRHYFEGDNWVALLQRVSRGPVSAPSAEGCEHGPAFDAWFARACAFSPAARFATCTEQLDALAEVLHEPPQTVVPRRRLRLPHWKWVALGVTCKLAAVLWDATGSSKIPAQLRGAPPALAASHGTSPGETAAPLTGAPSKPSSAMPVLTATVRDPAMPPSAMPPSAMPVSRQALLAPADAAGLASGAEHRAVVLPWGRAELTSGGGVTLPVERPDNKSTAKPHVRRRARPLSQRALSAEPRAGAPVADPIWEEP